MYLIRFVYMLCSKFTRLFYNGILHAKVQSMFNKDIYVHEIFNCSGLIPSQSSKVVCVKSIVYKIPDLNFDWIINIRTSEERSSSKTIILQFCIHMSLVSQIIASRIQHCIPLRDSDLEVCIIGLPVRDAVRPSLDVGDGECSCAMHSWMSSIDSCIKVQQQINEIFNYDSIRESFLSVHRGTGHKL